jgi:proteasome lid subunit RPN8/RPN11
LSTPFRLVLHRVSYLEMLAQAQAELPNECCGILAGTIVNGNKGRLGQVVRRYPLVNAAASPIEYLSEPKSHFAADRDMRALRIDVLAVYHSHPTSEPIPSKKDREQNYWPDAMHLIISLMRAEPLMRAWWLTAEDFREAEWELEITAKN